MTLCALISWLRQECPSAGISVESDYIFKPGIREDLEIRVHVWLNGRTVRVKGPSVEAVHHLLIAELSVRRFSADALMGLDVMEVSRDSRGACGDEVPLATLQ